MKEGLMVWGFRYMAKSEILNGQRCLDEKNKMDEKKIDLSKDGKSPSGQGINRVLIFKKLRTCQ
jgi:hypothetical protein